MQELLLLPHQVTEACKDKGKLTVLPEASALCMEMSTHFQLDQTPQLCPACVWQESSSCYVSWLVPKQDTQFALKFK